MLFLKNRLISLRAKRIARKDTLPRYTVDFGQAKHIGIIYQGKPPFFASEALELKRVLEAEGKSVTVLSFYQNATETHTEETEVDNDTIVFTPKDISLLGTIKSEAVDSFMRTHFDYLYCIAPPKSSIFDLILAKSLAKCRVGCDVKEKRYLYDMMIRIKAGDDVNLLIDEMLKYTRVLV